MEETIKIPVGKYKYPVKLIYEDDRIFVKFRYNKKLIEEVKSMDGAKWHGFDDNPRKLWSIKNNNRNRFQIDYYKGLNPYKWYDKPLIDVVVAPRLNTFKNEMVNPYEHQIEMIQHGLTRQYCLFACEMGTGKTLAAIYIMEKSGFDDWWWIGPRSALNAVKFEFIKWDCKIRPYMYTYNGLRDQIENWPKDRPAPRGIIIDESSRLKNSTTLRSEAAMHFAEAIRKEHGKNGYVIEMSGSPAPKSPVDWWHQCEVVCPGFLKEGTQRSFQKRLGLYVERESMTGGVYPHLVTWRDDENKCEKCGQIKDHGNHDPIVAMMEGDDCHIFQSSKNEVAYLYERMKGLVIVKLKKDCLDLPEKQYRLIECKPDASTLRAAKLIAVQATRAIEALTLLRELSDGFQYKEMPSGEYKMCPLCKGAKKVLMKYIKDDDPSFPEMYDPNNPEHQGKETVEQYDDCQICQTLGTVEVFKRETVQIPCPKEDALRDLLDEYSEVGRLVIYAGFTGSVDRCVSICQSLEWYVWRVDGRGWVLYDPKGNILDIEGEKEIAYQDAFLNQQDEYPRMAFVGQPGAGGMGLNLTASPAIVYYSNDFNGENRIQSEDRIHRPGMDLNRGATIIDLVHLHTDQKVLDNLQKKRDLQAMSLGELREAFNGNT